MERSKESRQQPPVMEECRLPMLGEEQPKPKSSYDKTGLVKQESNDKE